MMIEQDQSQVVRKIFRSDHQTKTDSAEISQAVKPRLIFNLLTPNVQVEGEQHEEDHQSVFLADAVVGNCINAKRPEGCRPERGPTIEQRRGQKKERDSRQRAKQYIGKSQSGFVADGLAGP